MTLFINKLSLLLIASLIQSQNAQRLGYPRTLADGGELTDDDKQALLDIHNEHRAETALGNTGSQPGATNMVELVWDEDIAEGAKAYADLCIFEHDETEFGENLYAAASTVDSIDNIAKLVSGVTDWYEEHEDYTYDDGSCSGVCGHYTQVVWAESTRVGCGYAECSGIFDDSFSFQVYLVCRYDPPGNWVGEKPYEEASDSSEVASNCPTDTVPDDSGLCSTSSDDDGSDDGSEDEDDEDNGSDDESNNEDDGSDDESNDDDENTDDLVAAFETIFSFILAFCTF